MRGKGSQVNEKGAQRACTDKYFMTCKPRMFYGNEGVVGLTRWIEKIDSVFEISSCIEGSTVKFVACTFPDVTMS